MPNYYNPWTSPTYPTYWCDTTTWTNTATATSNIYYDEYQRVFAAIEKAVNDIQLTQPEKFKEDINEAQTAFVIYSNHTFIGSYERCLYDNIDDAVDLIKSLLKKHPCVSKYNFYIYEVYIGSTMGDKITGSIPYSSIKIAANNNSWRANI